jgi:hypothetical protein
MDDVECSAAEVEVTCCGDCPFAHVGYDESSCGMAPDDDTIVLNLSADARPAGCPLDGLDLGVIVRAKR